MILTGSEIEKRVRAGDIIISPFSISDVNPNSYNYHLDKTYIEISSDAAIDSKNPVRDLTTKIIPEEGLVLNPESFYLCNTMEKIGSQKYVTSLIGKSSMGRLGIYLQISANLGHQNEVHKWTLEIRCIKPVRIYPGMIIGQVTFWNVIGARIPSNGYYTHFDLPTLSRGLI